MSDPDPLAEIKQALEQPGLGFGVELQERGHEWVTWLVGEVERLRAELAEMKREYDQEHHGMGVPGSDFGTYGGSYHDRDGNPL